MVDQIIGWVVLSIILGVFGFAVFGAIYSAYQSSEENNRARVTIFNSLSYLRLQYPDICGSRLPAQWNDVAQRYMNLSGYSAPDLVIRFTRGGWFDAWGFATAMAAEMPELEERERQRVIERQRIEAAAEAALALQYSRDAAADRRQEKFLNEQRNERMRSESNARMEYEIRRGRNY